MNAGQAMTPLVATDVPVVITIAVAAVAIVVLVLVIVLTRRTIHPTKLTVAVSITTALVILIGALLVGGSLTQPPTAAAMDPADGRGVGHASLELKLAGIQLPTL